MHNTNNNNHNNMNHINNESFNNNINNNAAASGNVTQVAKAHAAQFVQEQPLNMPANDIIGAVENGAYMISDVPHWPNQPAE